MQQQPKSQKKLELNKNKKPKNKIKNPKAKTPQKT